ncbi:MAG: ABC transporter permease subunit [Eubacteriales bacterium]|nr:ABC transporter permease subunit [Eubacteriales bacterium]
MMNKAKKKMKLLIRQWQLQSMVWPGLLWMAVFSYIPLVYLVISFMNYDISVPLFQNEWVGLKHFKAFLADDRFWRSVVNTLGMSALKICIGFFIPIFFALLLNEMKSARFKKVVQTISYLPHFISWAIFGGILLNWLSESGIINQLMMALHLQSRPVLYNGNPDYFWGIAFLSDIVKETGWSAIIYLAAIAGIDPGLYEAAELDGANRWQKMRHITLQCIRPTVAILFILQVSNCLGSNFDQIFFMKNSANMPKAETIDLYIYNMGLGQGRYSFSTSVLFFRSIIAFGLLQLCNFVSKKLTGETII